ncbi:MAG: transposase [Nitrosopumilus sp. B06]|nr:MAG: transposase [Nitrosopumilus sp. B06]
MILSDNGTQFTAVRKNSSRHRKITVFEQELSDLGIIHIKTRIGHPQTNGKLERFFGTFELRWDHFGNVPDFISYYNEDRFHSSLDMDAGETPRRAFANKKVTTAIRKGNPRWFEEDLNQARRRSGRSCSLTSSQALD